MHWMHYSILWNTFWEDIWNSLYCSSGIRTWIKSEREFPAIGPATEKPWRPYVLNWKCETTSRRMLQSLCKLANLTSSYTKTIRVIFLNTLSMTRVLCRYKVFQLTANASDCSAPNSISTSSCVGRTCVGCDVYTHTITIHLAYTEMNMGRVASNFFGNCPGLGWVQWHCDMLGTTTVCFNF